jgi:hypothetical protein
VEFSFKAGCPADSDCAAPPPGLPKLWGHSALFDPYNLPHWGPSLAREMKLMTGKG